tara:strand:+ start:2784 stop:3476 length:693 start_codon:yes stop_codon:yes gene_type:complete
VSVVVPVYNGEKFLNNCLEQLINQTYENIEIIVVDDGSEDGSFSMMQEFSRTHKNISIFKKDNGGTASALNLGFENCKGKYLTWVSCDDIKYPHFIERLVGAMEKSGCELCFSIFEEYVDSTPDKRALRNFANMKESGIMYNFLNVSYHYCITGICFMFSERLKKMCGPFSPLPGEDYIMGVKMGLISDAYFVAESLGAHVLHADSLTVSNPNCTNEAKEQVKSILRAYA